MRARDMAAIGTVTVMTLIGTQAEAARWIVKNPSSEMALVAAQGEVKRELDLGSDHYVVVETTTRTAESALTLRAEASRLESRLGAESVTPDFPIGLADADAVQKLTTAGETAWHVQRLDYKNLPEAAAGEGILVAVLDTGVDHTHPALVDAMWTNPGEIAGNGLDDDANGYVDDIHGYSFSRQSGDASDSSNHGTHCAGIIAARPESDGDLTARGVAPKVRIMSVHIIQREANLFLSDAAAGVKYAVDNGAKVLSNSWRVYKSWGDYVPNDESVQLLRDAVRYSEDHGAIFVAASGNESRDITDNVAGDPIYPVGMTDFTLMVGVAASKSDDGKASFTNFGAPFVHVAAPGDAIISTLPSGQWGEMSGTSMATPIVAGAIARGLSAGYTPQIAVSKLQETSQAHGDWSDIVKARGVVDLKTYLQN